MRASGHDVVAVASMLKGQFRPGARPSTTPRRPSGSSTTSPSSKAKAERLTSGVSKWQQTLSGGVIDLQADVDHDRAAGCGPSTRQADEALEASDPAETWDEFQAWLYRRVAEDVVHNYTFLHTQAQDLTARVAEHFGEDGADIVVDLDVANPTEVLTSVDANTDLDLTKMGMGSQGLAALRGSYGGLLMFGMLGHMAGLAMANPATIVIGLFMGRSALRGEKERQLNMRRGQARQAHHKYTDEVSFVVGKDSRDTLRRTQRRMRDFFAARAEELHRSTTTALAAAQQAVKSDASARQKRLRDVEAELKRIAVLRDKAYALAPELKASAGQASAASGASAWNVVVLRAAGLGPQPARAGRPGLRRRCPKPRHRLQAVLDRLDEPLRVAIAGKVKAGKSTLLNALVGEELAPTGAGECTRIVTWYRDGITYRATLEPRHGDARQVPFTRDGGAITIDLGGTDAGDVNRLVIEWPSSSLRQMTLIDTPGIRPSRPTCRPAPPPSSPPARTRSRPPTPCCT